MRNGLKKASLLVVLLNAGFILFAQRDQPCCENAVCKATAENFAVRMTGLVGYLPKFSSDPDLNKTALDSLKNANPAVYNEFMKLAKETHTYFFGPRAKFRKDGCFSEALPTANKSNVVFWVGYVGNLGTTPPFPSAEFCTSLKLRIEIGQGATDISKNYIGYLGSMRGYLVYTPGKKDECGNRFRILAGPAIFFRSSTAYAALSTRVAIRMKDIRPAVFPLGNLNIFGEYSTSFGNLSYGAIGVEVELGPFGFNLSGANNMKTGKKGFSVNAFYRL